MDFFKHGDISTYHSLVVIEINGKISSICLSVFLFFPFTGFSSVESHTFIKARIPLEG